MIINIFLFSLIFGEPWSKYWIFKLYKKQLFESYPLSSSSVWKLKLIVSISIYRIAGTCIFLNFSPLAQTNNRNIRKNTV